MDSSIFKDVVIIGNGPSGIALSYMLAGNWPFYNDQPHPIDFLQHRLQEAKEKSVMEKDLQYLSEGLEGRSANPVSVLLDTLIHPLADQGNENPSVLSWKNISDYAIDHVVLGRGLPGGAWQKMEGNTLTISLGSWMELPELNFRLWNENTNRLLFGQSGLKQKRASVSSVAKYYHHFVESRDLKQYFKDNVVVTSVSKVTDLNPECESMRNKFSNLWKVTGNMVKSHDTIAESFSYITPNVVLATGNSDQPNRLNIEGDDLPFVLYSLAELENVIHRGELSPNSGNLLIVGAGLSAADAVIAARFHGISITHVFRRSVYDRDLIFNKLPQNVYPEYHKVHQMMKDSNQEHYDGYKAFHQYEICGIKPNGTVSLAPCSSDMLPSLIQVSHVLILIGMHPDLSFLPNEGVNLGIYPNLPVHCKKNPIDINLYTHECVHEHGLYAVGPLVGDNFVRFVQGGCLAAASNIWKNNIRHK